MRGIDALTGGLKSLTIERGNRPEFNEDGSISEYYPSTTFLGGTVSSGTGYLSNAGYMRGNSVVWTCIQARQMPFSEVRFQLQEIADGRPGRLYDDPMLDLVREPWVNGTTGALLSLMEMDVSLAGNSFIVRPAMTGRQELRRIRPDQMVIISEVDERLRFGGGSAVKTPLMYVHTDPETGKETVYFPREVAHYAPMPDPLCSWRGMSWLTPLFREVKGDQSASEHKEKYFDNGAQLSTAITYDPSLPPDVVKHHAKVFSETHEGPANAYKTLHIGGGASVEVFGTEMKGNFKAIQSLGETRIAAASGVGAVIARFSEGLAGSALNQGNYEAAKRQFADMLLRPLWRSAADALASILPIPANSRLWYDDRDVEFLKSDVAAEAEIQSKKAATLSSLLTAGFTPESALLAVESGDMNLLEHSGLYSVQLQAAGSNSLSEVTT